MAPISRADLTVANVRTGCSLDPKSTRPPAVSSCTSRSWRDTVAALMPSACIFATSSVMRTSRLTPPTRLTEPTPGTASKRRASVLSTNQLRASSSIDGMRRVYANTAPPEILSLLTTGSRKSAGKSERTCWTAERVSSRASCVVFSSRNSAVIDTTPSCTLV